MSAYKYLNPNFIDGYFCEDDGKTYYTTKRLVVDVEKVIKDDKGNFAYRVKVKDGTAGDGLLESVLLVKHEDLINSPARTFSASIAGIAFAGGS